MRTRYSPELAQVLTEAQDIAHAAGQPFSSTHLLLALFTVPNEAEVLLREKGIDEDVILQSIGRFEREGPEVVDRVIDRARILSSQAGQRETDCIHLLVAVLRTRDVAAHRLLGATQLDLVSMRNQAMGYVTGHVPRRLRAPARSSERRLAEQPVREQYRGLQARGGVSSPPPFEARQQPTTPRRDQPDLPLDKSPRPPRDPGQKPPKEGGERRAPPPPSGSRNPPRRPAQRRPIEPPPPKDEKPRGPHELDPEEYPWLSGLGRNLTHLAAQKKIDPLIGRQREVEEVIDILGKRRTNNPILVGEPGVGKTAIVEGLAQALLALGGSLSDKIVVELDMASILAGTHLRGSFSEKLNGIKDEVRKAGGRVVVFIDEIHTIIGAGATGDGPQDAANELKAALSRGEFPCVGATTHDEYRKFIETDPALERRFTPVLVREPSVEDTEKILLGLIERYAEHHGIGYAPESLTAAATLSARYVADRYLPDKAIGIVDLAGSRARREGRSRVEAEDIARVVSKIAHVPEERLLMTDSERFLRMEESLAGRIVGHAGIIERVAQVVRRNYAGFNTHRPMGSFVFLGPTGVGKTELAKALAEFLYGSRDALVRCDMSEYGEPNTVARLVGAPPGYVGYGDGGQLTEQVRRRPFSVVLLDEVEKAHRDVLQVLLQILDEGHLTDGRGRQVSFANTVVLLTSNLGSHVFGGPAPSRMGFAAGDAGSGPRPDGRLQRVLDEARAGFPLELWNRIDERLVFEPLSREQIAAIARMLIDESSRSLAAEKHISFEITDQAVEHLIDNGGYDPSLGARPMRQTIQRLVEAPLADRILSGAVVPGDRLKVRLAGQELRFEVQGAAKAAH